MSGNVHNYRSDEHHNPLCTLRDANCWSIRPVGLTVSRVHTRTCARFCKCHFVSLCHLYVGRGLFSRWMKMTRSCMLLPNAVADLLPVPTSSSVVTKLILKAASTSIVTRILTTVRALRVWVLRSTAY